MLILLPSPSSSLFCLLAGLEADAAVGLLALGLLEEALLDAPLLDETFSIAVLSAAILSDVPLSDGLLADEEALVGVDFFATSTLGLETGVGSVFLGFAEP